jgi:hypothetical protein
LGLGRLAGGDPTAFETGDCRLGRTDELGELSLTQAFFSRMVRISNASRMTRPARS